MDPDAAVLVAAHDRDPFPTGLSRHDVAPGMRGARRQEPAFPVMQPAGLATGFAAAGAAGFAERDRLLDGGHRRVVQPGAAPVEPQVGVLGLDLHDRERRSGRRRRGDGRDAADGALDEILPAVLYCGITRGHHAAVDHKFEERRVPGDKGGLPSEMAADFRPCSTPRNGYDVLVSFS
jgi:hypothetical protein